MQELRGKPKTGLARAGRADNAAIQVSGICGDFRAGVHREKLRPGQNHVVFKPWINKWFDVFFRSPPGAAVFCIPPKLLSVLAFEIDQQPETNCAYNTNKPIQRGKTGCKVSKGRANRLAQPDELMCKIVTRCQPVGRSQLEERPQDEQIGNVRNEIFSDLICPHGPPPLHVLSASAFLWKADLPPVAVVPGWEHGSILLCLTLSGNTQKSRRSLRLPVQP